MSLFKENRLYLVLLFIMLGFFEGLIYIEFLNWYRINSGNFFIFWDVGIVVEYIFSNGIIGVFV